MNEKSLVIKKRGEDGSRIISLRIRKEMLESLDELAKSCNYSRNELINIILEYGIDHIEII